LGNQYRQSADHIYLFLAHGSLAAGQVFCSKKKPVSGLYEVTPLLAFVVMVAMIYLLVRR
jgi:hypothetical protein